MVRAARAEVFAAYTDVESMPKWSASAKGARVIAKDGGRVSFVIQAETKKGQRTFNGELMLSPPGKVTVENESGGSITKGTVTFEDVPDGTLVTSTVEVEIKGLRRFFVRPALSEESKEVAERNLTEFARYVEGRSSRDVDCPPVSRPPQ